MALQIAHRGGDASAGGTVFPALRFSEILEVKFVKEPVEHGRKEDADAGDEGQSAEQRVTAGKQFSRRSLDGSQGPHAGEDHGGVGEGVKPWHFFKAMITHHADGERAAEDEGTKPTAPGHAEVVEVPGQERLGVVFVHRFRGDEVSAGEGGRN